MKNKIKKSPLSNRRHNLDSIHYENLFDKDVNFKERVIYINRDIGRKALDIILKGLDEFDRNPELPVKIDVSSYGGDVYDMLGIVDRIKASPCHVQTRGFGKIMSAGTFIVASGDQRVAGVNTQWMLHEMSSWIYGSLSELKNEVQYCIKLQKQMYELYEQLTGGKTKSKTFEKLCQKDCYLTSQEILKLGLVDKLI